MSGKKVATPGQRFLDMRGYIDLSFLIFDWTINVFTTKNNYQPEYNKTELLYDTRTYGAGFLYISYHRGKYSFTNNNKKGSLDVVPGGLFNSGNDYKEEAIKEIKGSSARRKMYIPSTEEGLVNPHAFIPTHSALDTKGFKDWYQPIDHNLVCSKQTPFDSYYGEENNTPHVTFTQKAKNWLFKELGGFQQIPANIVDHSLTSPRVTLCLNLKNEVIVSLNSDPCTSSKAIAWEISSNLEKINATPYSITVKAINDDNSNAFIKAKLEDGHNTLKNFNILDKPTISFNNTSLRDAILAGVAPSNYPDVFITEGSKIKINQTLVHTVSWKYTRERKYIPEDAPGTHTYYDPASLVGDFLPYFSCEDDISSFSLPSKSVAGLVPLIDYHFQEELYRVLPDNYNNPLPDGSAYPFDLPTIQQASLDESSKIVFSETGFLEVEVTAQNDCGCATDTNVYKTAIPASTATTPQPFVTFTLTPNPAEDGFVTVTLDRRTKTTNPATIENINCNIAFTKVTTGTTLLTKEITFSNNTQVDLINLSNFSTGVYTVTVTSSYGTTSKQLIIE
ncbi:T9SS type A sorting domain-containing protein [Polaribacter batillariae]|uniref:T9SS type A sorting domain-containing protein n=1 Tax=Polaribacter batillariae TaxID=2808900 RepID=A0ABX7ST43_9FLAO|nr:T9SS type A sorting domain-containing protein [Polaribacter batillariae]QTD37415.1 T9SS type A sorting domain-containing protein [Polaribacter batillariae]